MSRPARVSDILARQEAALALAAREIDAAIPLLQQASTGWLAVRAEKDGDVLTAFNAIHDAISALQRCREPLSRVYNRALDATVETD